MGSHYCAYSSRAIGGNTTINQRAIAVEGHQQDLRTVVGGSSNANSEFRREEVKE